MMNRPPVRLIMYPPQFISWYAIITRRQCSGELRRLTKRVLRSAATTEWLASLENKSTLGAPLGHQGLSFGVSVLQPMHQRNWCGLWAWRRFRRQGHRNRQ